MRRIIAPAAVAFALLAIASCSADVKDFQEQGEKFIEGDQVRERFGMHEPVLDHDFDISLGSARKQIVDAAANIRAIFAYLSHGRPVRRLIDGQRITVRIDTSFKQPIEGRMKAGLAQSAGGYMIPVKGLEMTEVEDQAVPLRDRTEVKRVFAEQGE